MNFFKSLSVVLGAWMVLGGVAAVFFAEGLKRLTVKLYPEVRPSWIPVVGVFVAVLVLWTWMAFVKDASMAHFVVTLVMSLGLVKVAPMVFFYKKTREFLLVLVGEPLAFRVVVLSSAAVGLGLLTMGLFF